MKQPAQRCKFGLLLLTVLLVRFNLIGQESLYLEKNITGKLSPKSVVHNGNGLFFAQNMMYRHTVSVYNRDFELVKRISDRIDPKKYGLKYDSSLRGGPVECAFSNKGKYAWVSNYSMIGGGKKAFNNPGCDGCSSSSKYDSSYVYKINTESLQIEKVIQVGAVPKYVAVSPDNKWVIVSNWSSGDISIISTETEREVKRVKIGTFPRGVVVDSESKYAYVTVMGRKKIVEVDLKNYKTKSIEVGKGPRHLCISPDNKYLYLTLNSENKLVKINRSDWSAEYIKTGHQPRSMTIDQTGSFAYLVNYNDHSFSKYDLVNMKKLAETKTKKKPIGITYDDLEKKVWVACYSGTIQVFKDSLVKSKLIDSKSDESKKGTMDLAINTERLSVSNLEAENDSLKSNEKEFKVSNKGLSYEPLKFNWLPSIEELSLLQVKRKESKIESKVNKVLTDKEEIEEGTYLIVLGAYKDADNAKQKMEKLISNGTACDSYFNASKQITYVFSKQFISLDKAELYRDEQIGSGVSCWIFNKNQ